MDTATIQAPATHLAAFRSRRREAGWRRVDIELSPDELAAMAAVRKRGETHSMTVARLLTERAAMARPARAGISGKTGT